jgi:CBS domain-containing protein
MKASDVMTRELASVRPATPVAEIARLLLARGVSAVPVLGEAGEPLGVVSEADLVAREEIGTLERGAWWLTLLSDPTRQAGDFIRTHGLSAADVMTTGAVAVHPDASLDEVAQLMAKRHIRRVYVAEAGRLVGVITRADLLRALARRIATPATATRDGDLLAEIHRRLAEAPWARSAWVTLSVREGRVELSGAVESQAQQRALELLVRGVPGVVDVVDHLRRRDGAGVRIY